MVVKADGAVGIQSSHVAVVVGLVADAAAAAVARDVLHDIRIGGSELVGGADAHGRRLDFGRHLVHGHHVQPGECRGGGASRKRGGQQGSQGKDRE